MGNYVQFCVLQVCAEAISDLCIRTCIELLYISSYIARLSPIPFFHVLAHAVSMN